ncbi:MAG: hypothetical protein EXS12_02545 [Phycisphaerales bacterium]|nr:hypothetical protein [Phycisphaerales bacterium]
MQTISNQKCERLPGVITEIMACVLACASCVKQVTPLGSGRLIVNSGGTDTIVRSESGAVTRDTAFGFQLNSMAPVQTDGFFLPLASSDGMRLAWQQESNFNWPMLLALPEAPLAVHGVVSVRALDDLAPAHSFNGAYMLGRSCNSDGVLVESPQKDGARWIGVLPWNGGDASWLVQDAQVNAFACFGPRGELAWSHREIGEREFSLTVARPEGKFEWPRKDNESWMLPIVATEGIFAMRLRDGVLELAYLPLRAGQTMPTEESRSAIIQRSISLRGSEQMAYQCVGSLPPDRAVLADGSLLFFHPDYGRMAIWQPRSDTITPLPFGTLSATAKNDKQLLITFRDHLAMLSMPLDSEHGSVTLIEQPWLARTPSGEGSSAGRIILFLPKADQCKIAELNLN